jgi:hypothetical protein
MVPIQNWSGASSQLGEEPGSLRVLCDLRNWRAELDDKQAYLVAYDADRLRTVARGVGMDARLASSSWVALECLCAEKVPLGRLCEEVSIKFTLNVKEKDDMNILLRVAVVPKTKPASDWRAIGDAVMVRLSSLVGTGTAVPSRAPAETPSVLIDKLIAWGKWWCPFEDKLEEFLGNS